jgi:hypothetical protein
MSVVHGPRASLTEMNFYFVQSRRCMQVCSHLQRSTTQLRKPRCCFVSSGAGDVMKITSVWLSNVRALVQFYMLTFLMSYRCTDLRSHLCISQIHFYCPSFGLVNLTRRPTGRWYCVLRVAWYLHSATLFSCLDRLMGMLDTQTTNSVAPQERIHRTSPPPHFLLLPLFSPWERRSPSPPRTH